MIDQIKLVSEYSRYGPLPPPQILPVGDREIIRLSRAAPIDYNRYIGDRTIGPTPSSLNYSRLESLDTYPTIKYPFPVPEIIHQNYSALAGWLTLYNLGTNISLYQGIYYLSQIIKEGINYPSFVTIDSPRHIYWLRRIRLGSRLLPPNLTEDLLYLIPANLYERYPLRNLLSWYPNTGQPQLDATTYQILKKYGYFMISNWNPLELKLRIPSTNLAFDEWTITLETLISHLTDDLIASIYKPLERLYIQLQASGVDRFPPVKIPHISKPLDKEILNRYFGLPQVVQVSEEMAEFNNFPCLLCGISKSYNEWGLCGHGVCSKCQLSFGKAKCPFCSEHFVAPDLTDMYVDYLMTHQPSSIDLSAINNLRQNRPYSFDWINNNVKLYKNDVINNNIKL